MNDSHLLLIYCYNSELHNLKSEITCYSLPRVSHALVEKNKTEYFKTIENVVQSIFKSAP